MLDLVSDRAFEFVLFAVVVICGLLSGPVVDFVVRHRGFFKLTGHARRLR